MATLDLEEQEQLDQLKHFWRRYGNLISWTLVVALGGYAAWNGWQYWQRDQGAKAGGMYAGLVEAAQANDAARAGKVFDELKDRYGGTAFAEQGGLLAAKVQADQGKASEAEASLRWVAEHAKEDEYRAVARLRLAGLLLDRKQVDDAAKQLAGEFPKHFEPLAADRRGDVLLAQGKADDAVKAYQQAYAGLTGEQTLRRLVEAKLASLGATPPAVAEAASGAAR
jgi:predicted negative regulator of RcsB-dependent stress response